MIAFVLVPLFYKRNLVSIYSYLGERFGKRSYRSGAAMFFISEILGASVRFFVVCAVLQILVCDPLGIPFAVNVLVTISLIWLYTARGGVKTLIWTDVLKSACLILSIVLCIYYIARNMGIAAPEIPGTISSHPSSQIFHFDVPRSDLAQKHDSERHYPVFCHRPVPYAGHSASDVRPVPGHHYARKIG